VKRCGGRGEIAQKASASATSSRLHSREDLHQLVQMVVTSTQDFASERWREILDACLALPVQSERMIQHNPAEMIHPSGPYELASLLPIVALIGPEFLGDVRGQIMLSG
jgi:hypothetical protein